MSGPPTIAEIVNVFAESRLAIGKPIMPEAMRQALIERADKLSGDAAIDLIESRFSTWERHGR